MRASKRDREVKERKRTLALAAFAGIALTCIAAAITAAERTSLHPWTAGVARGVVVAVPIAVGLYTTALRPYRRFGWMLVLVGVGCAIAALSESENATAYSIGRVAGWCVELGFIGLVLAFPAGRIRGVWARRSWVASVTIFAIAYLPTALLASSYPTPSLWSECRTDCPANALQIVGSEPAFIGDLRGTREALTIFALLSVIAVLVVRLRPSTIPTRLVLAPVLVIAAARLGVNVFAVVVRHADPDAKILDYALWTSVLMLPALAMAFLIGLLRLEVYSAHALERLSSRLHDHPDLERLREAMADALGDRTLKLAFWSPHGQWVDAEGQRVDLASVDVGHSVTTIRDDGTPSVAIIHDPCLDTHPELLDAAGNYAAIALNNHKLVAQVTASMREIQESRARILATADAERRRIERDLHDGAQQRLVALRIKLELVKELIGDDPQRGNELLTEIGDETVEALEDVRRLAHGAYPALLAQRGLTSALRNAFLHSPIPVKISTSRLGRYPAKVESGIYFCCLEAVQNVVKHANGASLVTIVLTDDGDLRFDVVDDGSGFDLPTTAPGAGLTNMRDRVEGLGGRLTYRSALGSGTSVSGVVPAA